MNHRDRVKLLQRVTLLLKGQAEPVFGYEQLHTLIRASINTGPSSTEIARWMIETGRLRQIQLPGPGRQKKVFAFPKVPIEFVAMWVHKSSYLCSETAAALHKLIPANPHRVYVNSEQKLGSPASSSLTQPGIDSAFKRAPRTTTNYTTYEKIEIVMLNGKNTDRLGVQDFPLGHGKSALTVRMTDLERTLIDLATRPAYVGGPSTVCKAYEAAVRHVSIPKLAETLKAIAHVYPYHQALGFYLERTGAYSESELTPLRQFPAQFDFYLAHNMRNIVLNESWRIYVPQELAKRV